jgi:DNA-binding PadR family transcriptional regulator
VTLHVARPRDLVELAVLGLLCEQPRHPYDMQRQLKLRGNTAFVRGLPRSLYHAVDHLVAAGFVQAGETEREGTRPERTVYSISDDGRAEYTFRLQQLIAQPSDAATFHAALSLIGGLDRKVALGSLRNRAAAVDGEIARSVAMLSGALEQLPRLWLIEVEYVQSQLEAEAAWLRALIAEIESGALEWAVAGQASAVIHPPDDEDPSAWA